MDRNITQVQKGGQWRVGHESLIKLVNGELRPRGVRILCELDRKLAFSRAALEFVNSYGQPIAFQRNSEVCCNEVALALPPCLEEPQPVVRMRDWLDRYLAGDLYAAILHGSLATGEVINYSDFDALVIIRNEVLTQPKRLAIVAQRLFEARQFMYEQDPLQHHGWFVLPEVALSSWPEDYLPVAVLRESCHLMTTAMPILRLNPILERSRQIYAFFSIARAILLELRRCYFMANLYRFKCFLSKAMLLPALYVQARDGVGVFKRESFNLARHDFTEAEWTVMNLISKIRLDWPRVQPAFPKPFSLQPGILGDLLRKYRSQNVPVDLQKRFSIRECASLAKLIQLMELRIKAKAVSLIIAPVIHVECLL